MLQTVSSSKESNAHQLTQSYEKFCGNMNLFLVFLRQCFFNLLDHRITPTWFCFCIIWRANFRESHFLLSPVYISELSLKKESKVWDCLNSKKVEIPGNCHHGARNQKKALPTRDSTIGGGLFPLVGRSIQMIYTRSG